MTFENLIPMLCGWYNLSANEMSLTEDQVSHIKNDILRDYYKKFGALTEPFARIIQADGGHLEAQDVMICASEVISKDSYAVFCYENQAVFSLAAHDRENEGFAFGTLGHFDSPEHAFAVGISLSEILVTFALREAIFSAQRTFCARPQRAQNELKSSARRGISTRSRYLGPDDYHVFHFGEDAWLMEFQGMEFCAKRGSFKKP